VVVSRPSFADVVILRNGDHITGRILSLAAGALLLATEGAGSLTIDARKLSTFSSDHTLRLRIGDGAPFESRISAGPDGKVQIRRPSDGAPELISILAIVAINPPAPGWSGSVTFNGKVTGGDSRTRQAGVDLTVDRKWQVQRLHFTGEYMYGRERDGDTGLMTTSDDFGNAYGKYEHDVHDALYGDVNAKILHDQLAELRYRVSPALGVGHRWSDTPELELFTDVGIAYTDEKFTTFGGRHFWGPQVEYGVKWKPAGRVQFDNTLEYYPSFSDFAGNYLLDTKATIRVSLWRHTTLALTGEYHFDSQPAPSAHMGEYRFTIGPGIEF
jgi:hypothetical protein